MVVHAVELQGLTRAVRGWAGSRRALRLAKAHNAASSSGASFDVIPPQSACSPNGYSPVSWSRQVNSKNRCGLRWANYGQDY